jgi:hypothetical protein
MSSTQAEQDEQHPRPVHVTRADEVKTAHGQTQGMIRQVRQYFSRACVWDCVLSSWPPSSALGLGRGGTVWDRGMDEGAIKVVLGTKDASVARAGEDEYWPYLGPREAVWDHVGPDLPLTNPWRLPPKSCLSMFAIAPLYSSLT